MDIREKYIEAGKIAGTSLKYGCSLIKVGEKLLDVTEKVEQKVLDMGGEFAFPPQISLNEIAAHYCADPEDETIFKKGDLAKLDVGVMIDGYIGDTASTVNLGEYEKLVTASRNALSAAIDVVRPGATLSEIGRAIHDAITKDGFSPVRNLSGHGLSQYIFHDKPSIPNFDTGDKTQLKEGQVIAIEPFASNGAGIIYESSNANIFSQINRKPVRNMMSRDVLKKIESYKNMPFTTRWLARDYPLPKVNYALRDLMQNGIIHPYPPLPDQRKGYVSQAEHTMIVEDEPIVTTKV
ncbi:MAG: type II methionyl aminopeptidase [archaeon]